MANICDNELRINTESSKNIEYIYNWFDIMFPHSYHIEDDSNVNYVYFSSKWDFPDDLMDNLYKDMPDKEDIYIYMICLSVEWENCYHSMHECDGNGWREI